MLLLFLLLSLLSSGRNQRESERMESLCWTGLKLNFRIFHEIFCQTFLMAVGIITTSQVRISCHILNISNICDDILVWPVFAFIMAQRRFWIWSFHSHTLTLCLLCHTLPYFAILCHILSYFAVLCYTLPCRPELNLCLRRKSHFQENGHHYFLRSISNLLNKVNRFSTAGEVHGISMKIGIGEIYKKQSF